MKIPIVIISGFLGAGKSTFIKQLIENLSDNTKKSTLLVENDFGQICFDAQLLEETGVQIQELTSGCICCSLSGNFQQSLTQIIKNKQIHFILIEPSGVAKLSDILKALDSNELDEATDVIDIITVVDGSHSTLYIQNFGEFYQDQIKYAKRIYLTHQTNSPYTLEDNKKLIQSINSQIPLYSDECHTSKLINTIVNEITKNQTGKTNCQNIKIDNASSCLHSSNLEDVQVSHIHVQDQDHSHHHHTEDIFTTYTLSASGIQNNYSPQQWEKLLKQILNVYNSKIIRVKGILPTPNHNILIQYNGGNIQIIPTTIKGNHLTIIGTKIQEKELKELWV